jgi:hypothetical protein
MIDVKDALTWICTVLSNLARMSLLSDDAPVLSRKMGRSGIFDAGVRRSRSTGMHDYEVDYEVLSLGQSQ